MKYRILTAALLALALVLFNIRFISRTFDWDSITYLHNISLGQWKAVLYNPHHLAFESTGLLYMKILSYFRPDSPPMFSLRLRMLASGALFLVLFVILFARIYRDFWTGICVAACVAFTESFWFFSQHNDTALPPALLIALLFLLCVYAAEKGFSLPLLASAAVVQVWSIYFHQANVLFMTFVPAALLLGSGMRKRSAAKFPPASRVRAPRSGRWFGREMLIVSGYVLVVGGVVVAAYLYIGLVVLGRELSSQEPRSFTRWMLMYILSDSWGLPATLSQRVLWTWHGFGEAFLVIGSRIDHFRVNFSDFLSPGSFAFNMLPAFFLAVIALSFFRLRTLWHTSRVELVLFACWLPPSLIFFGWWAGYISEYWLSSSIALWLLSYLTLRSVIPAWMQTTGRALLRLLYLFLATILFVTNFTHSERPRSRYVISAEPPEWGKNALKSAIGEDIYR